MNTPPGLLGCALLFWGWQTGMIIPGVLLAGLLESSRFLSWRLEFDRKDLYRLWDACMILLLVAAVYCILTRDTGNVLMDFFTAVSFTAKKKSLDRAIDTVFIFFQWWPMICFPMALAQAFGSQDKIPLEVFSWYVRRHEKRTGERSRIAFNVAFPYFAMALLGASVTNRRDPWFYPIFCLLVMWALWTIRPKRISLILWLCSFLLIAKGGYWGHQGITQLSAVVEGKISELVARWTRHNPDGNTSRTSIGRIGRMKQSGQILLRVESEGAPPDLLREASYNIYAGGNWMVATGKRDMFAVTADSDVTRWPLQPDVKAPRTVKIAKMLEDRRAILPIPTGTTVLEHLPVAEVRTNRMGLVRADDGQGLVEYTARYGPGPTFDEAPGANLDLSMPEKESAAVKQIAADLKLKNLPLREKLARIEGFFAANFQYSTYLTIRDSMGERDSALTRFLTTNRTGHCEYFATATVLLLRAADIPARYATGFSIQESKGDRKYIVRERHAHAWTLYYDESKKTWIDFDTTPPSWSAEEAKEASAFEPAKDLFSNLWYRFSRWRWLGERGSLQNYLILLLLALIAFLIWRILYKQKRSRKLDDADGAGAFRNRPGLDSEFYAIEERLTSLGASRNTGESPVAWIRRLEKTPELRSAELKDIATLHYRLRFDPMGLTPKDRAKLQELAKQWLESFKETAGKSRTA
ncbi:MAG TPA: transglutaminase domain-containing protein [Roseimicrobium sp.]|nr:transglutaminase domain-containing protein [Roseimicrobium sp.]